MSMFYVNKAKEIHPCRGLTLASDNALTEKTPVNAVAASGVATFTGTPLVHVANVQGSGTVTITGTPVANETFVVNGVTFTFAAGSPTAPDVGISADNDEQADLIADVINATAAAGCTAVANAGGTVTVTCNEAEAVGTASNLVFTENATGIAVSGAGTLTGGVDHVHESLMIGTQEFIFVTARAAAGEVTVSANNTTQGDNLVAAIAADVTNVTASNNAGAVTITAAVKGTAGSNIALSEAAAPVTGCAVSSVTDNKLDGGIDGTIGAANETCANGTYLYHCIAANDTTGTNWRRVSLGSAY